MSCAAADGFARNEAVTGKKKKERGRKKMVF